MKRLWAFFVASVLVTFGFLGVSQPAQASQLEVLGASVSWDPGTLYEPTGCSSFNFDYINGTGIRLLQFEFQIKSRFGDSIANKTQIGFPAGNSGKWSIQICKSSLVDGLGPYVTELSIEDYQGSVRSVTGTLTFLARGGGTSTPAPAAPSLPSSNSPAQLDVLGASVSWDPSTLYEPTGCSNFNFDYLNGTGLRLLQFQFQIKSKFGDSIANKAQIGFPAGNSGKWSIQICKSSLVDGLGPYTTELSIEDYQGSVRSVTGTLIFLSRGGGSATPVPTLRPTQTPIPTAPISPAPTQGGTTAVLTQKLVNKFSNKAKGLNSSQKLVVAQAMASSQGATKVLCSGYRLASAPRATVNLITARARAACDYAAALNPNLIFEVNTQVTKSRSQSGQVLLVLSK